MGKGEHKYMGFPGSSVSKICLHWQETWVLALDQEDPLQKEMATHSSIFELEIPWTEESSGLQFMGLQKSQVKATKQHTHTRFGDLLNSLVVSENKQRPGWENPERLNCRDVIMPGLYFLFLLIAKKSLSLDNFCFIFRALLNKFLV